MTLKKNRKSLLLKSFILLLVLLFLAGILTYLFNPSFKGKLTISSNTSSMMDWQTYSNQDKTFSFQIPRNWFIEKSLVKSSGNDFVFSNLPSFQLYQGPENIVVGSITTTPLEGNNPTVNEFYNTDPNTTIWPHGLTGKGGSALEIEGPKIASVGNKKSIYMLFRPTQSGYRFTTNDMTAQYYIYYNEKQELLIQFNYKVNDPNKNKDLQTINQILSTFKFTQ